jgi:hypothetical protein
MTDEPETVTHDGIEYRRRRMTPVRVLYDTQEGYNRQLARCMLIHPEDAAEIIAFGGYRRRRHPAMVWDNLTPGHYAEMTFSEDEGRMELARDIIGDAIEDGRLRCAFVREGAALPYPHQTYKSSILLVVPPDELLPLNPVMSWEDGSCVSFGEDGDEGSFDEFFLFWDELVGLRPVIAEDFAESTGIELLSPVSATQQPGHTSSSAASPGDPGYQRTRSNRGKPAKPYGKAIAKVLVRAAAFGIDAAAAQGNKVVGEWLREAYAELHVDLLPKVADAGRDAKAAILALQAIMAGSAPMSNDAS